MNSSTNNKRPVLVSSGLGYVLYILKIQPPLAAVSPAVVENAAVLPYVLMIRISRMPASISVKGIKSSVYQQTGSKLLSFLYRHGHWINIAPVPARNNVLTRFHFHFSFIEKRPDGAFLNLLDGHRRKHFSVSIRLTPNSH